MVGKTHTSMQRGLGKVRRVRMIVMGLLLFVAVAIIFIDKKDDHRNGDVLNKGTEVTAQKVAPVAHEIAYETPVAKPLMVASVTEEQYKPIQVVSPITEVVMPKKETVVAPLLGNKEVKSPKMGDHRELAQEHATTPKNRKMLKRGGEEKIVAEGGFHVVKAGETLSSIAAHYYCDSSMWLVVQRANRELLRSPKNLKPGQKLKIPDQSSVKQFLAVSPKGVYPKTRPTPGVKFESTPKGEAVLTQAKTENGQFYHVSAGETLSSIAKRNGISFLTLLDYNRNLKDVNLIPQGTKIWIPSK